MDKKNFFTRASGFILKITVIHETKYSDETKTTTTVIYKKDRLYKTKEIAEGGKKVQENYYNNRNNTTVKIEILEAIKIGYKTFIAI